MTATEYNKLNDLLSQFSTLTAALEGSEAEIKTVQLAAAHVLLPKHAAAKVALANLKAERHPLRRAISRRQALPQNTIW